MACYHPLKAYGRYIDKAKCEDGVWTNKRKMDIVFANGRGDWQRSNGKLYDIPLSLPCGKCIGCRLEYSRQWAIRCLLEMKNYDYDECWFVTLTYDDKQIYKEPGPDDCDLSDMVRYKPVVNEATGEVTDVEVLSLQKKHLQDFMKRLRINAKRQLGIDRIRFFACGEYGETNHRPHYHLILFGLRLDDRYPFGKNHRGETYYRSPFLEDAWKNGHVAVGRVTFDSCAYVARYITKKVIGKDAEEYYESECIDPEFCVMSRRPGLAKDYYDEHSGEIYKYDQIVITRGDGSPVRVKPPHYFDMLYDIDNSDDLIEIKSKRREVASVRAEAALQKTDLDEDCYLEVKENNKRFSLSKLLRNKV